jgi:hypothetical protein
MSVSSVSNPGTIREIPLDGKLHHQNGKIAAGI